MMTMWIEVALLLLIGIVIVLPLLFERTVRESRFLSLTFRLKYLQHIFPAAGKEIGVVMNEWLPNKERWEKFDRAAIGKRIRTIRELTGSNLDHHLEAVALSGALVQDIVAMNLLKPTSNNAKAPLSSGEILKLLILRIDAAYALGAAPDGRDLRAWLSQHPIDFEQVVELILAAVEILHSRLPVSAAGEASRPK